MAMQRLYSTFPNALPGKGLLVLRLAVGLPMILGGAPYLAHFAVLPSVLLAGSSIAVGMLLVVGLWTPFAACVQMVVAACAAMSAPTFDISFMASAAVGLGLVLLGPGATSIDAFLFGRRRIDI